MFKNIDVLHGAGVLDGYKGAAARLPEFGRYNLIYGWNASGKTTLSRFFRLMEGPNSPRLSSQAYARFAISPMSTESSTRLSRAPSADWRASSEPSTFLIRTPEVHLTTDHSYSDKRIALTDDLDMLKLK